MATNADRPEDLNALERRLSAWQPTREGLNADSMLFVAGRASLRSGPARFAWPALTLLLTALSVVLSLWLVVERDERLVLAAQLQRRSPAPTVKSVPPPSANTAPPESPSADELPPDSYLASRRALEKGLDAWPSRIEVRGGSPNPSLTDPPVLRLGQRDVLLDP